MADVKEIDEQLYSRQLFVMGHAAQSRMQQSDILIVGLRGTGVEIAKNIILMGVKSVTLFDPAPAAWEDLSAQFYLTPADVGKPRAAACAAQLAALNSYVHVAVHPGASLSDGDVSKFTVVVACDVPAAEALRLNAAARAGGGRFVLAESRGVFGRVFVDCGPSFVVDDATGEPPASAMVESVALTAGADGRQQLTITCHEDTRHGLSDGDVVTFTEVQGMTGLNGCPPVPVRVTGPYTLTVDLPAASPGGGGATLHAGALGGPYVRGGWLSQVKQPVTMAFKPLAAMAGPVGGGSGPEYGELVPTDFGKAEHLPAVHAGWDALHGWMAAHGGSPPPPGSPSREAAVGEVVAAAEAATCAPLAPAARELVAALARGAAGVVGPMCAAVGGAAAQEVLKAASGKFSPLVQWAYLDAAEALAAPPPPPADCAPLGCRYDGQIAVFGAAQQAALRRLRYFLVGAGAIGCEVLKNFAVMGLGASGEGDGFEAALAAAGRAPAAASSAGSAPAGGIILTDMDRIEKSNLSRQFLFRPGDIGAAKSTTAAAAARAMNAGLRTEAHEARVGPDAEGVFGDAFWEGLAGACTALDNVDARLYVDGRCVYYGKPLLESGTLGPKGNTQVVVPRLTENYGASRDPPEKSIPVCTLKNFPNKIEHTLQWARDVFEGEFKSTPDAVNAYLSAPGPFLEQLARQTNSRLDTLERIGSALGADKPTTVEDSVAWARAQFQALFHNSIAQLLHNFPPHAVTSSGEPFWSGPKRAPTPLAFDAADPLHAAFIHAAVTLHASLYGLKLLPQHTPAALAAAAAAVPVAAFAPRDGVQIAASDKELEEQQKKAAEAAAAAGGAGAGASSAAAAPASAASGVWDVEARAQALADALPPPRTLAGFRMSPLEFEKDDDGHIAYVAAAGNLRARNYAIPECDAHTAKGVAGKIIPAIATTTALVAGLVCLEAFKLHPAPGGAPKPLAAYRNAFVNLALPLFSFSEPMPVPTHELRIPAESPFAPPPVPGEGAATAALAVAPTAEGDAAMTEAGGAAGDAAKARVWRWSLWDRIDLAGPLTLREFVAWYKENLGLDVQMVSYGASILYAFYMKPSLRNERLKGGLGHLAESVSKRALPKHASFISLEVVAVDEETGDEVELPYVRYRLGPGERREAEAEGVDVGVLSPSAAPKPVVA